MSGGRTILRGAAVIPMDGERRVLRDAHVVVEGRRIAAVGTGPVEARDGDRLVEASGKLLLPGFVQTHVHLCQTLFRGLADDLPLLDWLRLRIWPMEAAHDEESLYWGSMIGIAELIASGTTTILDMATVHHTEAVFSALEQSGLRAISGACMMDDGDIPRGLWAPTETALQESARLLERWHGRDEGRLRYGFAPRFVLCCSEPLLVEVARMAEKQGVHFHTHAAENRTETDLVRARCGAGNIAYFDRIGVLGPRTVLAHCVWLEDAEYDALARTRTAVAHCPGSNLKLGSGIASVPRMLQSGIRVSLGCDGAPCNNTMDMFAEMRAAAVIQKPLHGPASFTAHEMLELATIGGARALGLESEIGSIEPGKRADLVLLDLGRMHSWPQVSASDPVSAVVYSARPDNVELTMVDGRILYEGGRFSSLDAPLVRRRSAAALERLLGRLD
jgi:5-methylthioadenosine/S-adenosylhomocysteine deaminase